jgi:3-methylcrotonyl-CoA carboxylase beta subunit
MRLATRIRPTDPEFRANAEHMERLVAELRAARARVAAGGSPESRQRHTARGKLLARERVERLLDPGTPFLELSQLAAFGVYGDDAPGAGSSRASAA